MTSETSPLLGRIPDEDIQPEERNNDSSGDPKSVDYHATYVILICSFLILATDVAAFMSMAPLTRLLESVICEDYYRRNAVFQDASTGIPEHACKINPIQSELAMLKGWSAVFDCLPGLLLAIPYGALADTVGKKPVIVLGMLGGTLGYAWLMIVCNFPQTFHYKLAWFSSVFYIIGGGATVISSMIMAMVADVVSESQRSIVFFRLMAVTLVPQFVVVPISSLLMERNVWLPMFIGLGILIIATLFTIILMPETTPSISPILEETSQDSSEETRSTRISRLLEDSKFIFTSPTITTLLFTFVANSLGNRALDLLIQYGSKRYDLTIGKASDLVALLGIFQLVLLLIILPAISSIMTSRFGLDAKTKDLYICRGSIVLLLVGATGIGFSAVPALAIASILSYAMGYGFSGSMQSLLTSLVEPHQVARLYAAITIVKMVGGVGTSPMLSILLSWGFDAGGMWTGLPFFVCGIIYLVVAVPLCTIRLRL